MRGVEVSTRKVLGLTARGWRMGTPQDAGWVWDMEKALDDNLHAHLALEGDLLASAMTESPPEQMLGDVVVMAGDEWSGDVIALGDVPPLLFSELVRDLERLRD